MDAAQTQELLAALKERLRGTWPDTKGSTGRMSRRG